MRILLIEDDEADVRSMRRLLGGAQGAEFRVEICGTLADALDRLGAQDFDAVLADLNLPDSQGMATIRRLVRAVPDRPVVAISRTEDETVAIQAIGEGAQDYIIKGRLSAASLQRVLLHSRERKQAELQIQEQAEILNRTQDAIIGCGLDGTITYWNLGAQRLYGWTAEEALGRYIGEVLQQDDSWTRRRLAEIAERKDWTGEVHQRAKDGRRFPVLSRWTYLSRRGGTGSTAVVVVNSDLTERKRLEKQLLRVKRMEGIGALACGIAHDLNNLLTSVMGAAELIRKGIAPEQAQQVLNQVDLSLRRGADLVQQLLTFGRGVEGQRAALDVASLIDDSLRRLDPPLPANIDVESKLVEPALAIVADADQIRSVLTSLIENARDAMPSGGRLTLGVAPAAFDAREAEQDLDRKAGQFVRITIQDTGIGIPEEIKDRVFEPFFTTKTLRQGTGLGLSTALGIVQSHGGFMTIESQPGVGSSFHVFLPAARGPGAPAPAARVKEAVAAERPGLDGLTVLLVDDEAPILQLFKSLLTIEGAAVLTAGNGLEGLDVFRQHEAAVQVIVTDLDMPELDGIGFVRRLRSGGSRTPVVVASGVLTKEKTALLKEELGVKHFLAKPFNASVLIRELRDAAGLGA